MTLQQRKSKKFGEALDEFEKFRKVNEKLLEDGKITLKEFNQRISDKADELDL